MSSLEWLLVLNAVLGAFYLGLKYANYKMTKNFIDRVPEKKDPIDDEKYFVVFEPDEELEFDTSPHWALADTGPGSDDDKKN